MDGSEPVQPVAVGTRERFRNLVHREQHLAENGREPTVQRRGRHWHNACPLVGNPRRVERTARIR